MNFDQGQEQALSLRRMRVFFNPSSYVEEYKNE